MTKISEMVGLAALSAALTLGFATAEARDIKVQRKAAPVEMAAAAPEPVAADVEQKAEVGQAAAEKIVLAPGCRKVKVIYAGYGESDRAASCPAQ